MERGTPIQGLQLKVAIERGNLDPDEVRQALAATFGRRFGRPVPSELPTPPESWSVEFPAMAAQAGLARSDVKAAFEALNGFWKSI